jgi:hypothetical protein
VTIRFWSDPSNCSTRLRVLVAAMSKTAKLRCQSGRCTAWGFFADTCRFLEKWQIAEMEIR